MQAAFSHIIRNLFFHISIWYLRERTKNQMPNNNNYKTVRGKELQIQTEMFSYIDFSFFYMLRSWCGEKIKYFEEDEAKKLSQPH